MNWQRFVPTDFEYDFVHDELAAHHVTFEEAVECFFTESHCANHHRLGTMNARVKPVEGLSEQDIDQIVVAEADDEAAWEKPVKVRSTKPPALSLPPDLAGRAAFLAQLHRTQSVEEWLTRIIRERVEFEEAAFASLKQELSPKNGSSSSETGTRP